MLITVGSAIKDGEGSSYILDKMIGSGGFANVFRAHRESGRWGYCKAERIHFKYNHQP